MPRVSVIIPTYNCGQYISQAIDSVLAQTYRDLEILVVDDGSVDDTEAVVRRYAGQVTYWKTANRGPAAARNWGLQACTGEFVALLDADDWWEPDKLQLQMPEFDQDQEVGLAFSDLRVFYDDGTLLPSFLSSRPLASSGSVFDQYIQSHFILPSTVVMRRSCLEAIGRFDESLPSDEDTEFWFRFCYRWKVALVPKPLVSRRQRAGSLTSDEDLTTRFRITLYERVLQFPNLSATRRRLVCRQLAEALLWRGDYCLRQGWMPECRQNVRRSLSYDWKNIKALRRLAASCLPPAWMACIRKWRTV